MELVTAIAIPVVCLIGFVWVWGIESGNKIVFTPYLLLMVNVLTRVMPSFAYGLAVGISTDLYPLAVFFCGIGSLLIGFIFATGYLKHRRAAVSLVVRRNIVLENSTEIAFIIAFGLVVLTAAGLIRYQGIPAVGEALRGLLLGEEIEDVVRFVGSMRREITKGHYFGGEYWGQGLISTYSAVGWPFISSLSLIVFVRKRNVFWFLVFVVVLFLSFLFLAGDGTRSRFLNLFIVLFVTYSFVRQLRWHFLPVAFLLIVFLGIAMSLYSPKMGFLLGSDRFVVEAFNRILERIFLGNGINDVYAIEFIRDGTIQHRLGSLHLRDFVASAPGVAGGVPFAHELYLLLNPGGIGTMYATGTYITKAYVDFGIFGVSGIFFILGFCVGACEKVLFQRSKKTPLSLALTAMISFELGRSILTGFVSCLVSISVVLSFFVLLKGVGLVWTMMASAVGSGEKGSSAFPHILTRKVT